MTNVIKLDVMALAPHPDDIELGCGGTLLKLAAAGKKTGVADLTQGELGTRGSGPLRLEEAQASADILGLTVRENLGLQDGFFRNEPEQVLKVIQVLRRYQPDIILIAAPDDRHPDHGRAGNFIKEAAFYSGLRKIASSWDGVPQEPWRPKKTFHFIQDRYLKPDFVVDISPWFPKKIEAIKAFGSQFFDPDSQEPKTWISDSKFLDFIEARAREMGHPVGVEFAEGFISDVPLLIDDLMHLAL